MSVLSPWLIQQLERFGGTPETPPTDWAGFLTALQTPNPLAASAPTHTQRLKALQTITRDLLNQRDEQELLQLIVERVAELLDAPYVNLDLIEGEDKLVTRAFTRNQPFLAGDFVKRGESGVLSWQAFDTGEAVVLDDYSTWAGRRAIFEAVQIRATADIPIRVHNRSLGIISISRTLPNCPFNAEEILLATMLAQLAALVLHTKQLTTQAQTEVVERQWAELAVRQQNAYLTTLHRVALDLLERHDMDDVLQTVVEKAASLLDVPLADVALMERDAFVVRATLGTHFLQRGDRIPLGAGLMSLAYHTGQTQAVANYATWPEQLPALRPHHLRAMACVPILLGEQCLGILSLGRTQNPEPFAPDELHLATLFAQLTAVALDNARLYTAGQRQTQELLLLDRIRTALAREVDMPTLIRTVVEGIAETFGYTLVSVYLLEDTMLVLQHQVGYAQVIERLSITTGVMGRVARTGYPVLIEDAQADPAFLGAIPGIVSEICVPLFDQDQTMGILNIESTHGVELTISDLQLMMALSEHINLALTRARLYATLQQELIERRQTEDRLQALNAELARSNADLEQFAYTASHDLQEPLRQVTSYTQLLAKRYRAQLDSDAQEFIDFAVDGASRMQALIKGLLEYSRVGREAKFEQVALTQVLAQALDNLQLVLDESQGQVTADPLPLVTGNAVMLTQLLQNLVSNALKFRGALPPQVHIAAQPQRVTTKITGPLQAETEWLIRVRDNGIGIAPEYTDRIFMIFQRLHSRDVYPGTGIGLALCKKIVEWHGGHIGVTSQPGEGSTFFFTLPAIR